MMLILVLLALALCQSLSVSGQMTIAAARYELLEKLLFTKKLVDNASVYTLALSTFYLDSLDARTACRRLGGTLIEITNRRMFNTVVNFLETLPVIDKHVIHINGRNINNRGFQFGSQQSPYLDWHRGEPNQNDGEECLAIERRNGRFRMNNVACRGFARRYLCKL